MHSSDYTDVVLFSGGFESALCAARVARRRDVERLTCRPVLLFFNYAQSYLAEERRATSAIAEHLQLPLIEHELPPFTVKGAFVEGRNEKFMVTARALFPSASALWIGVRAPNRVFDSYGDANARWAWEMGAKLGFRIEMPALCMSKRVIAWRLHKFLGLPSSLIFSSEGRQA